MVDTSLPRHQGLLSDKSIMRERNALLIQRMKEQYGIVTIEDLERVSNEKGMRLSEIMASVA